MFLRGGELPAMVVIDTVSRLVQEFLIMKNLLKKKSFSDGLLEYPQYTRPADYNGKAVPEVLLSGHHANIEKWRHEKSLERTKKYRPDLYETYNSDILIDETMSIVTADENFEVISGNNALFVYTRYIHPDDVSRFTEALKDYAESGKFIVVRMLYQTGEYHWMLTRITDGGGI